MWPKVIRDIRRKADQWYHLQDIELLTNNIYSGNDELLEVVYSFLQQGITQSLPTLPILPLENFHSDETLNQLLVDGDLFYYNQIRVSGKIESHNQEYESPTPLSWVLTKCIKQIVGMHVDSTNSLSIYDTLCEVFLSKLGSRLAHDGEFQSLSQWMKIYDFLDGIQSAGLYQGWMDNLSREIIREEKKKIYLSAGKTKLSDLVYFEGSGADNEATSSRYEETFMALPAEMPTYERIQRSVQHIELLTLCPNVHFQWQLILKLEIEEWLTFINLLPYPIVQKELIFSVTEFEDLEQLIKLLVTAKEYQSFYSYTLVLLLDHFFRLVTRSIEELLRIITGSNRQDNIKEDAKNLLEYIRDNLVAERTMSILTALGDSSWHTNTYLPIILDWIASCNKLNGYSWLKNQNQMVDHLSETVTEFLASKFPNTSNGENELRIRLDFRTLKILSRVHTKNPSLKLEDSLARQYEAFIASDDFFYWGRGENADINGLLNYAYDFARLIAVTPDPIDYWLTLFEKHMLHHQGWKTTISSKNQYRETYLLSVGAGVAFSLNNSKKAGAAYQTLQAVSQRLIVQIREAAGFNLDYSLPLLFVGLALKDMEDSSKKTLLENLIFKLDEVEMLLIMLKEAFHEKDLNLSASSRLRLTKMLETESQKKLISKGRVDNLKNYHDIIARILAS